MSDTAEQEGKPFAFVITQAKPNTRLTVQAMAALSAHGTVAAAIMELLPNLGDGHLGQAAALA